jgi:hypothetical protein
MSRPLRFEPAGLSQPCAGHAKLETTALYTRVAVSTIRDVKSPLEPARPQPDEATARLTKAAWRGPRIAVASRF